MTDVMHDRERKWLMRQAAFQMQHEAARLEGSAVNLRAEAAKLLAASEAKSKRFYRPVDHARSVEILRTVIAEQEAAEQEIADQEAAERHERFKEMWGLDPLAT